MKRALAAAGSLILSATVVTVIGSTEHAGAATLSVPGSYRTIGAAVAAAHSGDTVLVSAGTYHENITIDGKNIVLQSVSGADNTIIVGASGRSPVMFQHVSSAAKIQGFKIQSGNAPAGQGGAITAANGASPVIAYNKLFSNHANDGGAILAYNGSNPDIAYNEIVNNSANRFGGGVFAYIGSSPDIHNNTFTGNQSMGGGAIYLESNSGNKAARAGGRVLNNTITGNNASEAGGGIMLRTGEIPVIQGNAISGNRAPYGGGIHVETNGSSPTIVANRIQGNTAAKSSAYPGSGSGGGISVFGQSAPTIQSNIITSNRSSIYGGGIVLAEDSNSSVVGNTISSNTVVDNVSIAAGGGVFGANSNFKLWNNLIRANSARQGGGLSLEGYGSSWVLVNNTIVSNRATGGSTAAGGGLLVGGKTSGKTSIVNNLFQGNNNYQIFDAGTISNYFNNLADLSDTGAFFSYGTHGLTSLASLNGAHGVGPTGGNLNGGAGFVDGHNGNFALTRTSNAVNHARSTGAPHNDIRGAVRPYGGSFDIGAWEYTG